MGYWSQYIMFALHKKRSPLRINKHGLTLTEMPAALWVIFVGFCFPLLCLSLMTIRFGFLWEAAREAADVACQAQYYADNGTTSGQGAVTLAQNMAAGCASVCSGITLTGVNCYILVTPTNSPDAASQQPWGPNVCLSTPADPSQNLYQIQVVVSGQIQPIISIPGGMLGSIPGLNQPYPVQVVMSRVAENPPGLNSFSSSTNSN